MAIAGKVAITLSTENGGAWSADVTYDRLVAVKHNNNLYISRKTVANVEPPNDEFWFLALEGFGGDDVQALIDRLNELSDLIQAIIDGTTQVGNAKTLDGHGAEYFFPKSGGTINGNVIVSSSEAALRTLTIANALRRLGFRVGTDGGASLYDYTNEKAVFTMFLDGTNTFNGTASGNLPLSGGAVKKSAVTLIEFENTTANATRAMLGFSGNGVSFGHLGFEGKDNPVFRKTDGNYFSFLHTGNKPTGTYTGNGDATQRYINTGGIGDSILIQGNGYETIVTKGTGSGGNKTAYKGFGDGEVYFANGTCELNTDHEALNANGVTYTYRVL